MRALALGNPPPIQLGEGGPLEKGVGPETHVHKITNVPVFYMALGLNDFDACKSILDPLEGVGPELSTFLGPNGTRFACCHFIAQKSIIKIIVSYSYYKKNTKNVKLI
jgi:hypothetical protein